MRFLRVLFTLLVLQNCAFADIENNAPKNGIVVLVHGFMRKAGNMSMMQSSLKKEGWSVENWSYPSKEKYIEEHAEDLVYRLSEISKQHAGVPISFVTHSMGGLIVRCALNHPNCPNEAKMGRAVLVAPPNKGSVFARKLHNYKVFKAIAADKAGKQLMTTELEGFDYLGNFPDHMSVLVIAGTAGFNPMISGTNDGKVAVSETYLNTPHSHETVLAGHSWICHSPTVVKKAKAFLSPKK